MVHYYLGLNYAEIEDLMPNWPQIDILDLNLNYKSNEIYSSPYYDVLYNVARAAF